MKRFVLGGAVALAVVAASLQSWSTFAAPGKEPMVGHMVYFQLQDGSPANVTKFLAGCDKYLKNHPGEVFYAAGTLAKNLNRPVNDRDWDAALHIVFKTMADHDKYQDSQRHLQFIEEWKNQMKKVRVFDSLIESK